MAYLRNRHLTATETALNTVGTHNRQISPKTVGSRLREIGLRARRPYVGLPLTQARRLRRMAWLTAHAPRLFPMRQWRRVLFTDESRFTLYRADGRRRVYRRRGERFADACVVERDLATLAQLRNALIDEWNNIPMRTVNALVNSVQRRIRTAKAAARGGGGGGGRGHTRY